MNKETNTIDNEEKLKEFSLQCKVWDKCVYYRPIWYERYRCIISNGMCMVLCGEHCPCITIIN